MFSIIFLVYRKISKILKNAVMFKTNCGMYAACIELNSDPVLHLFLASWFILTNPYFEPSDRVKVTEIQ